ncbi:MAG: amidase [Polyangiales bacterium]
MAGFGDFGSYDGLGLAELVRKKEVTPTELVDACIRRVDQVNGQLNAVVTRMDAEAREAAKGELSGPFAGVPFFIKDLVQPVKGVRYTRGSRYWSNDIAAYDSELVKRYRKAGLVILGKTNTPEFGITPFTESELLQPAKNPWSTAHNTGGSSGGAGAVVGSRMAPMAHGGDGGGSIRIPASCCGVFGLKPTRARTPVGPDSIEGWFGFALDHALTRSVRDSAALLDATHGREVGEPYSAPAPSGSFLEEVGKAPGKLRIALCKTPHLPGTPHPDVLAAVEDAAKLCASLGHEVEEVRLPIDADQFALDFSTLVAVSTAADLDDFPRKTGRPIQRQDFETGTWVVAMLGRTLDGLAVENARRRLQVMARNVQLFLDRFDVLLTPTLGLPPPRIGSLQPPMIERRAQELIAAANLSPLLKIPALVQAIAKKIFAFIPYTPLANVSGQPSMTVPLSWNAEGLPIGSMFTARFGDEATLFRLAAQLESARPWRDRRAKVDAG